MSEKKIKFVDGQMYTYQLYNLVDPYSEILKQKLESFDFNNPPIPPRELAVSLIETMVKNRGIGMAANQVGLPYRVFVMGAEKVGFACFNPEILEATGEETYEEGCLSFPGLFIKILRAATIKVRYTDMNGVEKEETFSGLTARIFQHELDHLNGITYTTKVSNLNLERAKEKVKRNIKKMEKDKKAFELQKKAVKTDTNKPVISTPTPPIVKRELPKTFEYKTI
jgi:peptide deformylase